MKKEMVLRLHFLNMPFSHRGWILHIAMQIDCVLTEKAGYRKLWTKKKWYKKFLFSELNIFEVVEFFN